MYIPLGIYKFKKKRKKMGVGILRIISPLFWLDFIIFWISNFIILQYEPFLKKMYVYIFKQGFYQAIIRDIIKMTVRQWICDSMSFWKKKKKLEKKGKKKNLMWQSHNFFLLYITKEKYFIICITFYLIVIFYAL